MADMYNLSVSKIEKALLCPKAFKYQYIDKIPQPSVGKLIAGKVVHEVLEKALKEFVKTEKYLDEKTLDDMYLPTWEAMVKEEEEKETFIGWQWGDPEDVMKARYRPLIGVARRDALPTVRPWMVENDPVVEWKIDLDLRSEIGPFKLIGYIDMLEDSGVLADWKTTESAVSPRAKRTWLQFAAYSLFVYPLIGNEVVKCEKIFLVAGDNPHVERVPFEVGPAHRKYFVDVAAQVWKMVKYNIFYPNSENWSCKPAWCSYWAGCQGSVAKPEQTEEQKLQEAMAEWE